jgi:hypothetical protein
MEQIKQLLDEYSKYQPVEVVYRPNERVTWGRNRKIYDGNCEHPYNHRTILDCEVVFDFDSDKQEENIENSWKVCNLLGDDDIDFTVWDTGNKGMHIHTFWDGLHLFADRTLIKKTILKHYAYGMNIDYQLAAKHLVRMEYGINEKKRTNNKMPLSDWSFSFNRVPEFIIAEYKEELNKFLTRRIDTPIELDDTLLKDFLEGKFEITDGREKFMFFLINSLKGKLVKEDLVSRMQSWYAYSGGVKLSPQEIQRKVEYHINRGMTYSFGMKYFESLMKDYDVKRKE